MNPVIMSPVPIILFADGILTVKAAFRSETGAPMQQADIGFQTANTTLACDTKTKDGIIIGTISLDSVAVGDPNFVVGDKATIIVKTQENDTWSQTGFTAQTATNPKVSLATGGGSLTGFPWTITWNYEDFSGFYQNKWELRIKGSNLFGEVKLSEYSIERQATINGDSIAFASEIGGSAQTLECELEVWSTSGLSTLVPFTWEIAESTTTTTASATLTDGKMSVNCSNDSFFLFVLADGKLDECGYTETGTLLFDLPIKGARYFVVTLDENRIGSATELLPTGSLMSPRLDYFIDGIKQSIVLVLNNEESFTLTNSVTYENFLGRSNPVSYFDNATENCTVSAYFKKPFNTKKILTSLHGIEAVFRPSRGGIYRVFVDSASFANERSFDIAGKLDLSLTVVSGNPYDMFYKSPFFKDAQIYPAEDLFPSETTWTVA